MEYLSEIWSFLGDSVAETIAFCALLFTAYQILATRRHNKLMVKPHLALEINFALGDKEYEAEIALRNNGIGPAFIKNFKVFLDGRELNRDEIKNMRTIIQDFFNKSTKEFEFYVFNNGSSISEKDTETVLFFILPTSLTENKEELMAKLDKIDFYIEYESLYGQRYTFDSRIKKKEVEH